jgi:glycerol-3-phosphate cytidylyltransferase
MRINLPNSLLDAHAINELIAPLRKQGKTLVTTNGCFDLVHTGHLRYLTDAAALGDILVVGLNADSTVSDLKGPTRPIQNEKDRLLLMGSLKMIDFAFIFKERDPRAFLEILKPEIHVKGGDYIPENLPEREIVEKHGGRIAIVPFAPGYSTTTIVKKIISAQASLADN